MTMNNSIETHQIKIREQEEALEAVGEFVRACEEYPLEATFLSNLLASGNWLNVEVSAGSKEEPSDGGFFIVREQKQSNNSSKYLFQEVRGPMAVGARVVFEKGRKVKWGNLPGNYNEPRPIKDINTSGWSVYIAKDVLQA